MPALETVVGVLVPAVFSAGFALEQKSRKTVLKDQGQNDITEQDCDALCRQMRARWNELCLAQSDERYVRARWQQAALASAGATAAALALGKAALAAAASVFGAWAAPALFAAAAIATALAIAAAGFATSAFYGWVGAETTLNSARAAFSSARTQMLDRCGEGRTQSCAGALPACP